MLSSVASWTPLGTGLAGQVHRAAQRGQLKATIIGRDGEGRAVGHDMTAPLASRPRGKHDDQPPCRRGQHPYGDGLLRGLTPSPTTGQQPHHDQMVRQVTRPEMS